MDRIAQVVGVHASEIRRRNFLKPGQTTTTQQKVGEEVDLEHLLDRALELSDYEAKKKRFAATNAAGEKKRGMGIAAFLHGAGFTGSGERYLDSVVGRGRLRGWQQCACWCPARNLGRERTRCYARLPRKRWELPYENVAIAQPDTLAVPNSGPTVASRTAMVVGKLVQSAALGLRQTLVGAGLLREGYSAEEFRAACAGYVAERGVLKSYARYQAPPNVFLG